MSIKEVSGSFRAAQVAGEGPDESKEISLVHQVLRSFGGEDLIKRASVSCFRSFEERCKFLEEENSDLKLRVQILEGDLKKPLELQVSQESRRSEPRAFTTDLPEGVSPHQDPASLKQAAYFLEISNQSLRAQLQISASKRALLEKDLEALSLRSEAENANLTRQLTLSAAKVASVQKDLEALTARAKSDNADFTEQLRVSNTKIASLQKDPQGLRRIGILETDNKQLLENLKLLRKDKGAAEEKKQAAEKRAKELEEQMKSLQSNYRSLVQSTNDKKGSRGERDKINQLQMQVESLTKDNQTLVSKMSFLLAELESVSAVSKTREQECSEMTKKLELAWARVKQLTLVRFANRPRPDLPLKTTEV